MSLPIVTGGQNHSGSLIPVIWARKFVEVFYLMTCMAAITNTDYQGDISAHGDEVKINELPIVQSRKYVKGQKLVYDDPNSGTLSLLIDQARYFAFSSKYVDKKQASIAFIEQWATHYSETMKRDIEYDVFSSVYADAHIANQGATAGFDTGDIDLGEVGAPLGLTKLNIVDWLIDIGDVLDQQNVPDSQRWLTLPSWACAMFKKSELREANKMGDAKSILRVDNGRIGKVDRFEIFSNNNLAKGDDGGAKVWNAMGGHKSAITFATQLTETERLTDQDDFGELIRALQSFGFKTVHDEALAHLYIARG